MNGEVLIWYHSRNALYSPGHIRAYTYNIYMAAGVINTAKNTISLQEWAPGDYVHMAKPILPAVDSNHLLHYPQTNHPYTPARHHINMTTPIFTSTSPRKPPRPPAIPKIHHSHQVTKGGHTHLAPAGLVASVHRLAPINTSTVVRGRGLHHHHRHK